jgi:hypothetical protein
MPTLCDDASSYDQSHQVSPRRLISTIELAQRGSPYLTWPRAQSEYPLVSRGCPLKILRGFNFRMDWPSLFDRCSIRSGLASS